MVISFGGFPIYPGASVMLNRQGHLTLQPTLLQFSYRIQNVPPCIFERGWNGRKNSSGTVFIVKKGEFDDLLSVHWVGRYAVWYVHTVTILHKNNQL